MAAKSTSALWKETTPLSRDAAKPGQVAYTSAGWECNHCKLAVWNKDASRLAFHLCGDTTLRDSTNGFAGIGVCAAVP